MKTELSLMQRNLLREIATNPRVVATYYPPAKKLVALGLAEWTGKWSNMLTATDTGKSALNAL